jgi:tRNA-Thr(GGU) m(6)t(6)A37 methyltransferase TsaA
MLTRKSEVTVEFEPIGVVRSAASEPTDENWGEVISEIHLRSELAAGLRGLDQFSHVMVLFFMHQARFEPGTDLVRRPRGRADMPQVGIFAQRAKHRPNPIGITTVEILGVEGNVIRVKGLDAIDGTPVLDLKPYAPVFDAVPHPIVPSWLDCLMEGYF